MRSYFAVVAHQSLRDSIHLLKAQKKSQSMDNQWLLRPLIQATYRVEKRQLGDTSGT